MERRNIKRKARRTNYSSGGKWESIIGYSRAVRVGNMISVTGTTAFNEAGQIVGINDAYMQTKEIIKNIEKALEGLEAKTSDVTNLVIYVTDISRWEEIGKALSERFRDIKPCMTMVQVAKLIDPQMMVEIQAEAID